MLYAVLPTVRWGATVNLWSLTLDVIVAATVNAADLIDMSDDIGTIENGKLADIIAVDDSPLNDIEQLLDVEFVMKSGQIYIQ